MRSTTLIGITLAALLSGCAQLGGTKFKHSYSSIKDKDNKETVGTLFVWEADTSAAVLLKDGKACMQTALAVKTTEIDAKAKISEALLSLSQTAAAVAASPASAPSQPLADVTASIKEAAKLLTTTTERTAFLNVGMFYMCQLAANNSITQEQTKLVLEALVKAAASVGEPAVSR